MNESKSQSLHPKLTKKLMLNKETLRELTDVQLNQVVGGFFEAPTENKHCMRLSLEPACSP